MHISKQKPTKKFENDGFLRGRLSTDRAGEELAENRLKLWRKTGIIGENICIDGGMTRQMIYHGDNGWWLKKVDDQ